MRMDAPGKCKPRGTPNNKHNLQHGGVGTRLYRIWADMKGRVKDPRKNYKARNISVCKEWEQSFKAFREWAIEAGYDDSLTLDRINNNGNYHPSNCRWASFVEQANNRTNNVIINAFGKSMNITQWAKETGIDRHTIGERLRIGKWPVERALTEPKRVVRRRSHVGG